MISIMWNLKKMNMHNKIEIDSDTENKLMVVSGDRSRRMSEMVSEIKRYKLPVLK